VRAIVSDGKLVDRRGKDIGWKFPEFKPLPKGVTLDGEIVASTGIFEDISGRVHLKDKFTIGLVSKRNPAKFMVFDMVDFDDELSERRKQLEDWYRNNNRIYNWISLVSQYPFSDFNRLWTDVIDNRKEGLVMKFLHSNYEERRSSYWRKLKAFIEIVVDFKKWEEHPKGITIETDDGRRVVVNGWQADEVRKQIQKNGSALCEIQYLPQKNSNAWRFPSFRNLLDGGR
jgi:ATP-dependent DNA ligase